MKLDIEFVRKQFNQFYDNPQLVFCSNAGGSYVANQVNAVMNHYNSHTRVQPYQRYEPSYQAGQAMERALNGWAEALNISANELTIGPSTSINTYVMAQAIGVDLAATDEIIVTNQDHEANSGVWRTKAQEKGAKICQWNVDLADGLLDLQQLDRLLNQNTKWVFFGHCSNIVGTSNPVSEIVQRVKQNSNAKVFVDAVAQAPHYICDLKALAVDGYAFSLYKVYGPHQSLLYVNQEIVSNLTPQCHYFNNDHDSKLFNPAGPQHAQVASCAGVLDYFDALHRHHFNDTPDAPQRMAQLQSLIAEHETELTSPILDFLGNNDKVRLLGKNHTRDNDRMPTIAFQPLKQSALAVSTKMQDMGIGCESGHFYAHRLLTDLGIDAEDGVVRISLVHYNGIEEVEKILTSLERAINH